MRVGCIAPYTAYTADFLYSPLYIKVALYRAMAQAATLDELQVRLQAKLTSPIPAPFQGHGYEVNLVRGHEAAIRLVDARSFACLCCPAPMCGNGTRKSGIAFGDVLRHITSKQHAVCVTQWVKAARTEYLLRRLRLFAWVAGRALPWHARAVERAYAPGGRGYEAARDSFEAHAHM